MMRTSRYLVPLMLGIMAAIGNFVAGCSREAEAEKSMPPKSDPPSVYMKDKDFRAALEVKNQKRKEVLGVREKLLQELEKRVDAMREKLSAAGREGTPGTESAGREGTPGTESAGTPVEVDDAMVKKELEKDPEWNSLIKRIEDTNAAYDDNRKAATKLVAERLAARKQKPLK